MSGNVISLDGILDYKTFTWVPPIPMPEPVDNFIWKWSETNKEWIQVAI